MGYLAAYAGAELGAPAVRPEDGSLSQSVRPPGLQLLQPARRYCGFHGAGFTFAWITPVYWILEYKEHGGGKTLVIGRVSGNSSVGSTAAFVWKGLDGQNETMKR